MDLICTIISDNVPDCAVCQCAPDLPLGIKLQQFFFGSIPKYKMFPLTSVVTVLIKVFIKSSIK